MKPSQPPKSHRPHRQRQQSNQPRTASRCSATRSMSDVPTGDPPTDDEMEAVLAALRQVDPEGISGTATKKKAATERAKPRRRSDAAD